MTLQEAIDSLKDRLLELHDFKFKYDSYRAESEQLLEWLEELKMRRKSETLSDGTLVVNVDKAQNVGRVLVLGYDKTCGLYYPDKD